MPILLIKAVEYGETTVDSTDTELQIRITPDDGEVMILERSLAPGHRWVLDKRVAFKNSIKLRLKDVDLGPDDLIGELILRDPLVHKQVAVLEGKTSPLGNDKMYVWYEVLPIDQDRTAFHRPASLSVRSCLRRVGRGVLERSDHSELVASANSLTANVSPILYRCVESISIKETINRHAEQDRGRQTASLKQWLLEHCNPWGDESTIPMQSTPQSASNVQVGLGAGNWMPVNNERDGFIAGLLARMDRATSDNPFAHKTWDWNWDVILDPALAYMQTYSTQPSSSLVLPSGNLHPFLHCEWEWGSLPVEFRPFWGEYVTVRGRHVFDRGHIPVDTEIHPPHTVVREHTTATSFPGSASFVPANKTTISMGMSGGFPGVVPDRWRSEIGDVPSSLDEIKLAACYVTDLRKHPVKLKLFPATPRPSFGAVLRAEVATAEIIIKDDWGAVDDFLEMCTHNAGAGSIPDNVGSLGFQHWGNGHPRTAPASARPTLTVHDGFVEASIDLSDIRGFVAGYFAVVHCGWSERGSHEIQQIDVTFKELKTHPHPIIVVPLNPHALGLISEQLYGVNGDWAAFWDRPFQQNDLNAKFRVWIVDDMPLVIRSTGDPWRKQILSIHAPGPDHFSIISTLPHVRILDAPGADTLLLEAQNGTESDQWKLELKRVRI